MTACLDSRLNDSLTAVKGGRKMKGKCLLKTFVYFLCVSFLLMVNGFHGMVSEAGQKTVPVAQMISRGGVKFEVRENAWQKVETPFPVFEGMKIRTEKGEAVLALAEKTRIEIGSDSLFYFDQRDQFNLLQGKINFRMEPEHDLGFKVGNLRISKLYPLQAVKISSTPLPGDKGSLGTIMIHPSGSVTVKSVQGPLCVRNQDGQVLASLSSGESITLPSVAAGSKPPIMAANAEPGRTGGPSEEKVLVKWETWAGIVAAVGVVAVTAGVAIWAANRDDDDDEVPVCP
jgi:hypothetical protein